MATTASRMRSAPLRHDGQTDVYGVFSSARRLQPRYQDRVKAEHFDQVSADRARHELEAKEARKDRLCAMKEMLAADDIAMGEASVHAQQGALESICVCRHFFLNRVFFFRHVSSGREVWR